MYLHLGQNVVIPAESVVGVFDMDNSTGALITRTFLSTAEKRGQIVNVSDDIPKSFIVSVSGKKTTVYLSQLSSATLYKRSETNQFTEL